MPLPKDLVGDLVITSVTVRDEAPAPVTMAQVSIQNKGAAPVTFPAGSVLARGDAAQAGGIAFAPMTTPVNYSIPAGESRTLSLVADVCATARTGTVTFRVDPDNKVSEANEGNNTLALGSVSSFAAGDLQLMGVSFVSTGPIIGDRQDYILPAGSPVTMRLMLKNVGTGYVLACPGVAIWRETASPVSSKYGLRSYSIPAAKLYPPSSSSIIIFDLPAAYGPGDLPPGTYPWTVTINPDGRIRELSAANNVATVMVTIR